MTDEPEVLTRIDNGVGRLTLNRPKAINSLTQTMVDIMAAVLADWAADDSVRAVILDGAGERGLCAGGDVVALYHSARAGGAEARKFWFDEYRVNALIGAFGKPYVSLMDGIVMGGGVGVGAHGNVRVVTETTKMAMPEVGIGFIPDVGGTYLLSRAPGRIGLHAALTGSPFSGADAIALGFADHFVPHDKLAEFTADIIATAVAFTFVCRVEEFELHLGGGEGHAIEFKVTGFLHGTVGDRHMGDDGFLDVDLPDADGRDPIVDPLRDGRRPHRDEGRARVGGGRRAIARTHDRRRRRGDAAHRDSTAPTAASAPSPSRRP